MNRYNLNDKTSYCLGMSLTIEALLHIPEYISHIILSDKVIKNRQFEQLQNLSDKHNIKLIYDNNQIEKLSLKENCYCIGFFNKYESKLESDRHILLYQFKDYGELGTIIRSSVSFDFKDIVIIDSDIDYFDPRCIRASMGSIFHCNIVRYKTIEDYLKDYNYNLYPFVSDSDKDLESLKPIRPYALLLSEDYYGLDHMNGYSIKHHQLDEISLSIRSSIILHKAFSIKS